MKRTRISTRAGSESFLPEELLSFYLFNDTGIKRNLHEARSEKKSQKQKKKKKKKKEWGEEEEEEEVVCAKQRVKYR